MIVKRLLIILSKFVGWLLERLSTREDYVEPHYFQSDFGIAYSIRRCRPRKVWHIVTNRTELFCAGDHLFYNQDHHLIPASEMRVGDLIASVRGTDTVLAVKNLGIRAPMYAIEVIATPKAFIKASTANGLIGWTLVSGQSRIVMRNELMAVQQLVHRGPLNRLVEWLCLNHVRLAARHL